ncbi:hypothetical protein SAMN02990966_03555 [Rhodospirillales bacterium URHD0017]|nr:hypothetical protein SAMN02990966_03555 [Rhodospirillales bacterium URHD0017]
MPIYMEISPLHRLVTIVARGTVSGDEVRGTAQKLAEAKVRRFAKILEVASASFVFEPADIVGLAQTMRADVDGRGPIAFVVRDMNQPFPRMFATQTAHEGPVDLFKSLHEARTWIARMQNAPKRPPGEAWADPDRQGTVIRGARTREFTARELVH